MPKSPPPLKSNYNQNSLSALFDDKNKNLNKNNDNNDNVSKSCSPYREPRSKLKQNNDANKPRRTLSHSPSNKADDNLSSLKSSLEISESAPPPKHTERSNNNKNEEKSMSVSEDIDIQNIKNIPSIPNMMMRSTADPDEKKQASPIKNTAKEKDKEKDKDKEPVKDDVIRLNHRGFCIDLSHKNAELVPLGIVHSLYFSKFL